MKKVVMLTASVILGFSSIAVSQAENSADDNTLITDVEAGKQVLADAPEQEGGDATAKPVEGEVEEEVTQVESAPLPTDDAEPIPTDTPQVQKLMQLYPNLIARIAPVGKVCFEGEDCDVTARSSGGSADGEPRDGKAVYDAVCHTCHATGLLGSPALGDAGAWGPRIAKGKDTLYDHAIHGFNSMPAKGGADIPDEEVQNAVDYMVSQSS